MNFLRCPQISCGGLGETETIQETRRRDGQRRTRESETNGCVLDSFGFNINGTHTSETPTTYHSVSRQCPFCICSRDGLCCVCLARVFLAAGVSCPLAVAARAECLAVSRAACSVLAALLSDRDETE